MGILSKFVASKFSGYALIALIIAGAGAAYWFWSELKEFGGLQERAEQQAITISQQSETLARLNADMQAKESALQNQTERTQILLRNTQLQQLAVQEARKHANEALRNCLDMRIADGMRFGPSREDGSGEDKAGPNLGAELPNSDT